MKRLSALLFVMSFLFPGEAQVKIHAHNDYAKKNPLFDDFSHILKEIIDVKMSKIPLSKFKSSHLPLYPIYSN